MVASWYDAYDFCHLGFAHHLDWDAATLRAPFRSLWSPARWAHARRFRRGHRTGAEGRTMGWRVTLLESLKKNERTAEGMTPSSPASSQSGRVRPMPLFSVPYRLDTATQRGRFACLLGMPTAAKLRPSLKADGATKRRFVIRKLASSLSGSAIRADTVFERFIPPVLISERGDNEGRCTRGQCHTRGNAPCTAAARVRGGMAPSSTCGCRVRITAARCIA